MHNLSKIQDNYGHSSFDKDCEPNTVNYTSVKQYLPKSICRETLLKAKEKSWIMQTILAVGGSSTESRIRLL